MKFFVLLFALLAGSAALAEEAGSPLATPSPVAKLTGKWNASKVPWDLWFKKNAMVTDKTEYVHFFWNAQDFKDNFELKDKKSRLADGAIQLVQRLYPADSKADLMKVDIVYVLERDSYGMPKWDSLQRVAHLEFLKSKAMKLTKKTPLTETTMKKVFSKFEIF